MSVVFQFHPNKNEIPLARFGRAEVKLRDVGQHYVRPSETRRLLRSELRRWKLKHHPHKVGGLFGSFFYQTRKIQQQRNTSIPQLSSSRDSEPPRRVCAETSNHNLFAFLYFV